MTSGFKPSRSVLDLACNPRQKIIVTGVEICCGLIAEANDTDPSVSLPARNRLRDLRKSLLRPDFCLEEFWLDWKTYACVQNDLLACPICPKNIQAMYFS